MTAEVYPRLPKEPKRFQWIVLVSSMERVMGIEPTYSAWKAAALPLSYTRATGRISGLLTQCKRSGKHYTETLPNPARIEVARPQNRAERKEKAQFDNSPFTPVRDKDTPNCCGGIESVF